MASVNSRSLFEGAHYSDFQENSLIQNLDHLAEKVGLLSAGSNPMSLGHSHPIAPKTMATQLIDRSFSAGLENSTLVEISQLTTDVASMRLQHSSDGTNRSRPSSERPPISRPTLTSSDIEIGYVPDQSDCEPSEFTNDREDQTRDEDESELNADKESVSDMENGYVPDNSETASMYEEALNTRIGYVHDQSETASTYEEVLSTRDGYVSGNNSDGYVHDRSDTTYTDEIEEALLPANIGALATPGLLVNLHTSIERPVIIKSEDEPCILGDEVSLLSFKDFVKVVTPFHGSGQMVKEAYLFAQNTVSTKLSEAKKSNKTFYFQMPFGEKFFATPESSIYMHMTTRGSGGYKIALEVAMIANKVFIKLQEEINKTHIILMDKPSDQATTKAGQEEKENERLINQFLYDASKNGADLSHVCISQPMTLVSEKAAESFAYLAPVADHTNIHEYIERSINPEITRLRVVIDMALAVKQMHEQGYVHRDLKPDNFLIFGDTVKVADFGKASSTKSESLIEQPSFYFGLRAPEWKKKDASRTTKEADIYQLGVSFYHILTGQNFEKTLFGNLRLLNDFIKKCEQESADKTTNKDLAAFADIVRKSDSKKNTTIIYQFKLNPASWPKIFTIENEQIKNLVLRMLNPEPAQRPTLEELILKLKKI